MVKNCNYEINKYVHAMIYTIKHQFPRCLQYPIPRINCAVSFELYPGADWE